MLGILFVERLVNSEIVNVSSRLTTIKKNISELDRKKLNLKREMVICEERLTSLKTQQNGFKKLKIATKLLSPPSKK